ncbi:VPLPA-CTERM sorting domain-containing protein [Litorivita sp. NS0012-18]|uniref:VPLPA-CTERM sorting domain-containing protein n=1 Tax=Litorivita sp. NS0012-18 TaxID=3127655 RepID=UPI0031099E92
MSVVSLKSLAVGAFLALSTATTGQAATVTGTFGYNDPGGPFDAGFHTYHDMGSLTVGAGGNLCYAAPYNCFSFSGNTVQANFNIGAADLPFLGFVFDFAGLGEVITGVNILSNTTALTAGNLYFDADSFAIDLNGSIYGSATFELELAPAVPLPAGLPLLLSGLAAAGLIRRKAKKA